MSIRGLYLAARLASYQQSSSSPTYSYGYNGDGLRMAKTVNGTTEAYTWNVAEGLPSIVEDGTTKYATGPGGLPLEQIDSSGNILYYFPDQLGSTRGLVTTSGSKAATYTYDVYGNVTSKTGTATTPFQYAGQYTDSGSGLQYLQARYYDPNTGQFINRDPAASMSREAYAYAAGNPVNDIDPTGLYGYTRSYVLGHYGNGGAALAATFLTRSFAVWPFNVMGETGESMFQVGHRYELAPGSNYLNPQFRGGGLLTPVMVYGSSNPVLVTSVSSTSLTLESLPGHIEGAGNRISFSFCIDPEGETELRVTATGPTQWFNGIPVIGHFLPLLFENLVPSFLWGHLAHNLQVILDQWTATAGAAG